MPSFVVGGRVVVARDRYHAMRKVLALCAIQWRVTSDTTLGSLELERDDGRVSESWPVRQLSLTDAAFVREHLAGRVRWEPSKRTRGVRTYGGLVLCGQNPMHFICKFRPCPIAFFAWDRAAKAIHDRLGIRIEEPEVIDA